MPSSHSSFVTSLAMLVGFDKGFASTEFAITAVFAIIVMYDASGVRRAVGKQAEILNQIVDDFFHGKFDQHKKLKRISWTHAKRSFIWSFIRNNNRDSDVLVKQNLRDFLN